MPHALPIPRSSRSLIRARGFTLVELMVVVAIVGVLAAVGIVLMNRHVYASKSVEAFSVIQAIRGSQERFRAETQQYLSVSDTLTTWYPMQEPSGDKYHWEQPEHPEFDQWQLLAPPVTMPVQFGYATVAGGAGTAPPPLSIRNPPNFGTPDEPWYLIQATADADEDGVFAMFAASSFTGEVYSQEEGE